MSTISAGTTTPTALSLSGDTTGALTFQVNGTTTAATITSVGNVGIGTASPDAKLTVSGGAASFADGTSSAPAIANAGDLDTGIYFPAANEAAVTTGGTVAAAFNSNGLFFRNRIINGDMRIDQRNAGASITLSTTVQYPVDRFPSYKGTAGATVTAQQSSTAPTAFNNSIIYTVSTGATPAAGDINGFWQQLEGFNVADLGWGTANAQTVTLSFWVRSSVTGTYSVSFANSAANRFYVATYTVNSANTYEYKTITVAGDTSGTWLTNNGVGIQIVWDLGYGTNFNGTAGSWSASTIRRTSGSVQLIATTGATLYITGVQLETGSVATPFERRPFGTELMLCQRYYEKNQPGATNGVYAMGYSTANNSARYVLFFKVTKRAAPTISVSGGTNFFGQTGDGSNIATVTLDGSISALNQTGLLATFGGTNFTAGQGSQLLDNNSGNSWIAASAEL